MVGSRGIVQEYITGVDCGAVSGTLCQTDRAAAKRGAADKDQHTNDTCPHLAGHC